MSWDRLNVFNRSRFLMLSNQAKLAEGEEGSKECHQLICLMEVLGM